MSAKCVSEPSTLRIIRPSVLKEKRTPDWSGSMQELYLNDDPELFERDGASRAGVSHGENAMEL